MKKKRHRINLRQVKLIRKYVKYPLSLLLIVSFIIIIAPMLFSKIALHVEPHLDGDQKPSFEAVKTPHKITVYRTESRDTDTVDFEDYVMGVVSCEMPSTFHEEALKAQAVAARTYSIAKFINSKEIGNPKAHPEAPLCDTTHCQVYKSEKELKESKGSDWIKSEWPKIVTAVEDTKGQLLYFDGKLVEQALFHSSSGGKTENSEDVFASAVPYLVSVESPYEEEATHKNEQTSLSLDEFKSKLQSYDSSQSLGKVDKDNIKILNRSSGNRVEKIQVGDSYLTGKQIREALGLSSANFSIKVSDKNIIFTTNGSGHGVGMSQYGANGMAKEGYGYKKILSHYYSGTEVY